MSRMKTTLGRWTIRDIDDFLRESCRIQDAGKRIGFLSSGLLGTEYKDSTLTGSIDSAEVLVVDLEGVDCFTFIDYVEAMRLSCSFGEFVENLKTVRYREGNVSFAGRNHFFTDWIENREDFIKGSPITYAKNLQGNLLYIHGTGDDNVHYANAEMLINELVKYNKQFQFMAYPNRTHSISEGEGTFEHLSTLYTNFLRKHCPPGGR